MAMFAKVKQFVKNYFISEQVDDYIYFPTEDGVFAYYSLEHTPTDSAAAASEPESNNN
jgi:hypothetical protein